MFKHYLLMRYNVGLYSSNPYKIENKDEWMNKRLPLFHRFLESLEKQTSDNYTLILGIDAETPNRHVDMILDTCVQYKINMLPVHGQPSEWVKKLVPKEDWLITSRVDNDDEYKPTFIETIQSNFIEREEVLDVYGLQCFNREYYSSGRPTPNSPFISLVEPWKNDVKTVHYKSHSIMNGEYNARFVGHAPQYVQHIHDHNLANKLIGKKL
jgi:hypothetical protein